MKKRIVICDDSMFMRRILRQILEKEGYEIVAEASNGQEGYEMFLEHKPDLMTLDITMPVLSGLEALELISKVEKSPNVLMVSAMGQEALVVDALRYGAKGFIIKPFVPEKVIDEVEKIIR